MLAGDRAPRWKPSSRASTVRGLAGTYEQAFPRLREFSPLVLLFLGSSLGNLDRDRDRDAARATSPTRSRPATTCSSASTW